MKNTVQFWALCILAELMKIQHNTIWQIVFALMAILTLFYIIFIEKED